VDSRSHSEPGQTGHASGTQTVDHNQLTATTSQGVEQRQMLRNQAYFDCLHGRAMRCCCAGVQMCHLSALELCWQQLHSAAC
jgi:hypothetical protein